MACANNVHEYFQAKNTVKKQSMEIVFKKFTANLTGIQQMFLALPILNVSVLTCQ